MCVIAVCKTRIPKKEEVLDMGAFNPDGAGVAWIKKGMVTWEKGLSAPQLWNRIKNLPLPLVFHFRQATVGEKGAALCHPFPISPIAGTSPQGCAKKVLFHNGHWENWSTYCLEYAVTRKGEFPDGEWSDSRAMAWLAYRCGDNILRLIAGQKIAVMNNKGIVKLFGEGWIEDKGITYSNKIWENLGTPYWQNIKEEIDGFNGNLYPLTCSTGGKK
jgi:hypothetical protein